ncbi:hypothetical protein OPV22_023129 [Ensete ventricosum]|uniref:Uncharacterized protein n=1 Tax=Ensete ventricosum TaxID=4639 RepID=A0AAV8QS91_ENSVE|nr:hypothetical protein OPV22_023129 [Ensete ventricosum]
MIDCKKKIRLFFLKPYIIAIAKSEDSRGSVGSNSCIGCGRQSGFIESSCQEVAPVHHASDGNEGVSPSQREAGKRCVSVTQCLPLRKFRAVDALEEEGEAARGVPSPTLRRGVLELASLELVVMRSLAPVDGLQQGMLDRFRLLS